MSLILILRAGGPTQPRQQAQMPFQCLIDFDQKNQICKKKGNTRFTKELNLILSTSLLSYHTAFCFCYLDCWNVKLYQSQIIEGNAGSQLFTLICQFRPAANQLQ
jgi:hypothetical protein